MIQRRFLTLLLVVILQVSCGIPWFGVKIETGPLDQAYFNTLALNPMKICTPHMFGDVWDIVKRDSYRNPSNLDLYIWALEGLAVATKPQGPILLKDFYKQNPSKFRVWAALQQLLPVSTRNMSDLCYAAISGIITGLDDKWASFTTAVEGEKRMRTMVGEAEYAGLGFIMHVFYKEKRVFVEYVRPGSPAERGGLRKNDELISINGQVIKEMPALNKAHFSFRGPAGTIATIVLIRHGKGTILLPIIRGKVDNSDVGCSMIGNTPYCRVVGFGANTVRDFEKNFEALPEHSKKIILDLRDNPGGLVFSGTGLLSRLWIGTKFATIFARGPDEIVPYNDSYRQILLGGYKAVVLTNELSASTSELFAAAVKDYSLAKIIGTKTFGKGISQKTTFRYGAVVTISSRFFLSPRGNLFHGIGIHPDILVSLSLSDRENNRDPQLEAALKYLQ